MPINTLYQLFAAKRDTPELLNAARTLRTIPDLFHYWLTGNAVCEFSNATTTQLVNPQKRAWPRRLMERLDLPSALPGEMVEPGSMVGTLSEKLVSNPALRGTPSSLQPHMTLPPPWRQSWHELRNMVAARNGARGPTHYR